MPDMYKGEMYVTYVCNASTVIGGVGCSPYIMLNLRDSIGDGTVPIPLVGS